MYKRKKKYNKEKDSDLEKIMLHLKKVEKLRIKKSND